MQRTSLGTRRFFLIKTKEVLYRQLLHNSTLADALHVQGAELAPEYLELLMTYLFNSNELNQRKI